MYSKPRISGEYREKYRDKDRKERSERRRHSQDRDRKYHRRHRSKSLEGRRRNRSKSPKIESRRRKPPLYWDVPAPGYEHMTPIEYKALIANGKILKNVLPNVPSKTSDVGSTVIPQARRLYIGNVPFGVTEDEMTEFFNEKIHLFGFAQSDGNPVLSCKINIARNYAFLEFRSTDETTRSLSFDGIYFKGYNLKVRRPHEYQTALGVIKNKPITLDMMKYDSSSFGFTDSQNKLFVGGIPGNFNEDQVKDLLTPFGQLKSFHLIIDFVTRLHKGYAFCEFDDGAITDQVIAGLNGTPIGNKIMIVRRAGACYRDIKIEQSSVPIQVPGLSVVETIGPPTSPTQVLCLLNMVNTNELKDDDEYKEILEDIRAECNKYGGVQSLKVPRPIEGIDVPGCGKVFVEFNNFEDCQKALEALSGRIFNNRVVLTSYMEQEKYHKNEF
ncbi:splicing factor U2AF 50 kDa subunit-like isoform X2 [Melanaphis sacchari]|uniref:splicing factor U2AF 50 kDa subunit-like isoform X2 n=1 Tax=Melanaphis sacchari TaxID=742174 RepID=UPI000DC1445A|nr:splicing factor U2AF 50 kDa subunit-like isoform X2 [Melanaphis sacchari]